MCIVLDHSDDEKDDEAGTFALVAHKTKVESGKQGTPSKLN